MTDAERVSMLQGMVDGFVADVETLQASVADARIPDTARRSLAAALIYAVERFDLIPDHIEGVGIVDDAAILRLAAKTAVSCGANDPGLKQLAGQAVDLGEIFGDLVGPLEDYLNGLLWKATDGKTPLDVISDSDARIKLWREIGQKLKAYKPAQIVDPAGSIKTLRKLMRARLQKAGLVS